MGTLPWDDEPDSSSEQDPNKIADDDQEKLPWECYYEMAEGKLDVDELHRSTASPINVKLWEAVRLGQAEEVAELLAQGADAQHCAGVTRALPALHVAAGFGHVAVLELLVKAGAEVEGRDGEGWTALQMAADRGQCEAVRRLKELGGDVNARTEIAEGSYTHGLAQDQVLVEYGETALHWCTMAADIPEAEAMCGCLCDLGADVNIKTSTGRTALHWSVDESNIALAKALAARGADLEAKTDAGWTALTWAARMGLHHMVQALLALGADVHARCPDMRTALWWAEHNGAEDTADLLRKYGVADRTPWDDNEAPPPADDDDSAEEEQPRQEQGGEGGG